MLSPAWSSNERCGWCKSRVEDSAAVIAATFRSKEDIPYDSGQSIDRIIFLSIERETVTFENLFEEDPWIGDKRSIPVFCIPLRDDVNNFSVKTCCEECAKAVKAAVENEKYVFRWNFGG